MKFCAAMHEPVPFMRLGPQARQKTALLYNLLIALVKGRALAIVRRLGQQRAGSMETARLGVRAAAGSTLQPDAPGRAQPLMDIIAT